MKNIFFFILGAMFITLVSFGTGVSVTTIKPAKPVSTIVIRVTFDNLDNVQKRILSYSSQGYVVKTTLGGLLRGNGLIIMEKY